MNNGLVHGMLGTDTSFIIVRDKEVSSERVQGTAPFHFWCTDPINEAVSADFMALKSYILI